MIQLGNLTEDQTIDFKFTTVDTDNAPITLAGTPAISVYKANGTTESTAGVTLTTDFDSRTGLHHVRIDTSADAFYAVANDYQVVITTGTVDSISVVGTVLATFSIENRFNEVNVTHWLGGAVATPTQTGVPEVDLTHVSGAAVTGGTPDVNVISISGDSTAADNAESFFDGTGYAGTNNVIPTVTTTTNLTNKGDGSGFTAIPWNASWDAEVQSECTDALNAYDPPTNAEMEARTVTSATYATAAALATVDGILDNIFTGMELDGSVYRWTTNALEQGPSGGGGGGSPWDALVADYDTTGTFGALVMKNTDTITLGNDAIDDVWQRFMQTVTTDAGASTAGRALHYLRLAFSAAGVYSTAALANGGGGTPVEADVVDDSRTWFATDYRARNIITVGDNFAGTLALQPDLNPGTTILSVESVSITGAATVTATDLSINRAKTRAQWTVPALATTGTYTVVVTVTTIDGQTIPTTATLRVQ